MRSPGKPVTLRSSGGHLSRAEPSPPRTTAGSRSVQQPSRFTEERTKDDIDLSSLNTFLFSLSLIPQSLVLFFNPNAKKLLGKQRTVETTEVETYWVGEKSWKPSVWTNEHQARRSPAVSTLLHPTPFGESPLIFLLTGGWSLHHSPFITIWKKPHVNSFIFLNCVYWNELRNG